VSLFHRACHSLLQVSLPSPSAWADCATDPRSEIILLASFLGPKFQGALSFRPLPVHFPSHKRCLLKTDRSNSHLGATNSGTRERSCSGTPKEMLYREPTFGPMVAQEKRPRLTHGLFLCTRPLHSTSRSGSTGTGRNHKTAISFH
jgi:hypothetical protein